MMSLEEPFTALNGAAEPAAGDGVQWIPAIGADGVLYPIEKLAAHRQGQLHLAVSVFVFRGPELLIQQRAAGKYHCAGMWANSCCSHPHWGEAIAASAARRLREELGLVLPLTATAQLDYEAGVTDDLIECEHVHVFRAEAPPGLAPSPDPAEVASIRWARPEELMAEAASAPERFAPWFRIYLNRWTELRLAG
jgi:isopentenyl-diphosphate delta-isomerase